MINDFVEIEGNSRWQTPLSASRTFDLSNRIIHNLFIIIGLNLLFSFDVYCNQIPKGNNISANIETRIVKGLDFDGLVSRLDWFQGLSSLKTLNISHDFNVRLYQFPGFHRQWRTSEKTEFMLKGKLQDNLIWQVDGGYDYFRDEYARTLEKDRISTRYQPTNIQLDSQNQHPFSELKNEIQNYKLGFGLNYNPSDLVFISSRFGPKSEEKYSIQRDGIHTGLDILLKTSQSGMKVKSDGWIDFFEDKNDHGFAAEIFGEWGDSTLINNRFRSGYFTKNNQEITPGISRYGSRINDELLLNNVLESRISPMWKFKWDSELNRKKSLNENTGNEYYEFQWENNLETTWKGEFLHFMGFGGIDLQEQEYNHGLSQGRRTKLGLLFNLRETLLDSIGLRMLAIGYRFNTPDKLDFNDRDELRYQVSLDLGKNISSFSGIILTLQTDLRHFVYLYRSRSAENRWTRLFQLTVAIPWKNSLINNHAKFSVTSNYTVYDFEEVDLQQSRVFRFLTCSDSLLLIFNRNLRVTINAKVIIDEHGRFSWDKWKADLSDKGYSYDVAVLPEYSQEYFNLAIGWGWSKREVKFQRGSTGNIADEMVKSHGPIINLQTLNSSNFRGEVVVNIRYIEDVDHRNYSLPEAMVILTWMIN